MEQIKKESITKTKAVKSNFSTLRIDQETNKKLTTLVNKANKKNFGKRVRANQLVAVSLDLISDKEIKKLQQDSLTYMDKINLQHKEHCKKFGTVSKQEFMEILAKAYEANLLHSENSM